MKKSILLCMVCSLILFVSAANAEWDPQDREKEEAAVNDTINRLLTIDPTLKVYFDKAYAYAVFPTVGKGAFIAGVGYGRGWFFEEGKPIGKASITQLSAGAQIGGEAYSEIIFFRDKDRSEDFKGGRYEAGAQATALAVTEGVGKAGTYSNGVAVFIMPKAGLMADLSISGQRFGFEPF
ncbi:MAG TPA: lipid-binding SYLF domain-containing protein [Thermodesulfovibrionales bacterium]|nr:lipid-binding SYLF domain-containing protein [Thermodesulfovibrionales bacterium]